MLPDDQRCPCREDGQRCCSCAEDEPRGTGEGSDRAHGAIQHEDHRDGEMEGKSCLFRLMSLMVFECLTRTIEEEQCPGRPVGLSGQTPHEHATSRGRRRDRLSGASEARIICSRFNTCLSRTRNDVIMTGDVCLGWTMTAHRSRYRPRMRFLPYFQETLARQMGGGQGVARIRTEPMAMS